jgi:hypothetical protein
MYAKLLYKQHHLLYGIEVQLRDVYYLKMQLLQRSSMSPRFTINALSKMKPQRKNVIMPN